MKAAKDLQFSKVMSNDTTTCTIQAAGPPPTPVIEPISSGMRLSDLAGIDLRSLAVFRLGLAIIFLIDVCLQPSRPSLIIAVSALTAAMLWKGFRTRFATFAGLLILVGLHRHELWNPTLLLMLWSSLLPLGARFSLDSAMNTAPRTPNRFRSVATAGMLAQVCLIYCMMLASHHIVPAGFIAWVGFVPTWFWDRLFAQLATPDRTALVIYYDGECGFCRKMGLILRTFFLLPQTPLRPAQDDPAIDALMKRHNSWILRDAEGSMHMRFDGLVQAMRLSPWAFVFTPIVKFSPVRSIGNAVYDWVANHRGTLGKLTAFLTYGPIPSYMTKFDLIAAGVLFVSILVFYLRQLAAGLS